MTNVLYRAGNVFTLYVYPPAFHFSFNTTLTTTLPRESSLQGFVFTLDGIFTLESKFTPGIYLDFFHT